MPKTKREGAEVCCDASLNTKLNISIVSVEISRVMYMHMAVINARFTFQKKMIFKDIIVSLDFIFHLINQEH